MRLYLYYIFHTFINQIRKLFKTWVLIFFLVCALVGGLIGFGAGSLMDTYEDYPSSYVEEYEEEDLEDLDQLDDYIAIDFDGMQMMEVAASVVILGIFLFQIYQSDKSGDKIFLPADVNLLFASPNKPQTVLLFRLMTNILTMIFLLVYYVGLSSSLFEFMEMTGMERFWTVCMLVMAFMIAKLVQIFLYSFFSIHHEKKKYLKYVVYAVLAVLVGMFAIVQRTMQLDAIHTAVTIFTHPYSRYIPFLGWIKAFGFNMMAGAYGKGLLALGLTAVCTAGVVYYIWHMDADFYEEAMTQSEEKAAVLEAAQTSGVVMKRKKDRSEKLKRDGMQHGNGANVFFFKSMYNRFRFAKFYIFTKTSITYIVTAVLGYLASRYIFDTDPYPVTMLLISGMIFFRSLGSTLEEDTTKPFFRMIPEDTIKKLGYSILGDIVNCLLDLVPATLLLTIATRTNPLVYLGYLIFMISVYTYGMIVNSFIALSLPENIAAQIRQVIVVMFIYLGLVPDIFLIVYYWIQDSYLVGMILAVIVNLFLSALFLALMPIFLEPAEKAAEPAVILDEEQLKTGRKTYSKAGFGIILFMLAASGAQILAYRYMGTVLTGDAGMWLLTFVPMYAVGFPLIYLWFRNMKKEKLPQKKLTAADIAKMLCMAVFMMYAGNLIGNLIIMKFYSADMTTTQNVQNVLSMDNTFLKVLFVVILGPIFEEIIFRKILIDRLHPYGARSAILISGLLFGLFHTNIAQFFYACTLGWLFGTVYYRTGKLRYSIGLHMFINFIGSVVPIWLLGKVDMEVLLSTSGIIESGALGLIILYITEVIMALIGLVLVILEYRKIVWVPQTYEIQKGRVFETTVLNYGIAACILVFGYMTIMTLFR